MLSASLQVKGPGPFYVLSSNVFCSLFIEMDQESHHNEGSRESCQTNGAVEPTSFDGIVPIMINLTSLETLLIEI